MVNTSDEIVFNNDVDEEEEETKEGNKGEGEGEGEGESQKNAQYHIFFPPLPSLV